ncbi:MAG: type II secretion system protein, partial [Planctomycetota bacterium]|nr:type II secretion system protein [Planctomycetota bacterium]
MTQAGSHSCRGFTLIELLMTMTIIAVLAAVVLPKFTDGGRLR